MHASPKPHTPDPADPTALYAQPEDSRAGLAVGAALAVVLHAAFFVPFFSREASANLAGLPHDAGARVDRSALTPRPLVSPAPLPSSDKVTADEGDVSTKSKLPSGPMPPSKRVTQEHVKRTPAPPPPPTTAPAGIDKGSVITMAWISSEAFEAMVAEKGRVEQAGFQRVATPTPGAPMRTDPIPLAAVKENPGGEVSMQGAPGEPAQQPTPASAAQAAAKTSQETQGPPPARGIGADRVVQAEGPRNELPMKTSSPQGVTWEDPAVKKGALVLGDVLPGQGKSSDKESAAPLRGEQRGNIAAAPQPSLREAPDPTPDGKGRLSPGEVEAQPAVKEVAVSPAQPSVAPPTVVGRPIVPLKSGGGDVVPLGDSQAAKDQVSNQQAQQVGDRAQEARREVLPQAGQEPREAKPRPTGTANDAKNPPRPGIADDVLAEGARSSPSITLADKTTATGGKDDHSAGDGTLAMVVPNPDDVESAPAHTEPARPGIGSDKPEKPSDKTADADAKAGAAPGAAAPNAAPSPQPGRPSSVAQGAEHGGDKARVTSLPKSDRESPPVSLSPEPIKLRAGSVLVGKGIEIKTVMPRLSIIAQVTSLPANPEVRVVFARTGKVVNAEVIRSTGYPNWDGPILSSLYLWTVSGETFEKINGPVEFKFVILITD